MIFCEQLSEFNVPIHFVNQFYTCNFCHLLFNQYFKAYYIENRVYFQVNRKLSICLTLSPPLRRPDSKIYYFPKLALKFSIVALVRSLTRNAQ